MSTLQEIATREERRVRGEGERGGGGGRREGEKESKEGNIREELERKKTSNLQGLCCICVCRCLANSYTFLKRLR